MQDVSSSDGAFSRSNLFRNEPSAESVSHRHPQLQAVLDEFDGSNLLHSALLRVAMEMREYGLDPSSDEGQQTAARVLRERLTHRTAWVDGTLETFQRRADAESASGTEFVYYLDLYGSIVKIGYSANVLKRLPSLRRRIEHVLAIEPGGRAKEAYRHRMFDDERTDWQLEDFTRSDRLLEHIRQIRERYGNPVDVLAAVGREKRSA